MAKAERAAIQASVIAEDIYQEGSDLTEADLMQWLSDRIEYSQDEINEANSRASEIESRRAKENAGYDSEEQAQGRSAEGAGTGTTQERESGTDRSAQQEYGLTGQTNEEAAAEAARKVDPKALTKEEINAQSAGFGLQQQEGAPKPGPVQDGLRFSKAKDDSDFIESPAGSLEFGEITNEIGREIRRQSGFIRLREGDAAWGRAHIEARHGRDILSLGYSGVAEFVADVAGNFDAIYEGDGKTLILAKLDKPFGKMNVVLELQKNTQGDIEFYDVKNATPIRADQFKNKTPIWAKEKPLGDTVGPNGSSADADPLIPRGSSGNSNIQPTLEDIKTGWKERGITADLFENKGVITLSRIVVPEGRRGQGIGTQAMRELVDYADANGKHIALSPSADFGGNKNRLIDFYKRFGFVENKGRNRAFSVSESMIRENQNAASPLYSFAGQSAAPAPKSTITESRAALVSYFSQTTIKQLESKGMLSIVQTTNDAIDQVASGRSYKQSRCKR